MEVTTTLEWADEIKRENDINSESELNISEWYEEIRQENMSYDISHKENIRNVSDFLCEYIDADIKTIIYDLHIKCNEHDIDFQSVINTIINENRLT